MNEDLSQEARDKISEALAFASKELMKKTGSDAVIINIKSAYTSKGQGGMLVHAMGVRNPFSSGPHASNESSISGDAKTVAGEELRRILQSKKKGG